MPEHRAGKPRIQLGAAAPESLDSLGRGDPPPVPRPATNPFLEPQYSDGAWTDGTDPA